VRFPLISGENNEAYQCAIRVCDGIAECFYFSFGMKRNCSSKKDGELMSNQLKEIFVTLQEQLETSLRGDRVVFSHPGSKGDVSETNWLKMLEEHIPNRYQIVNKAFIIDSNGNVSDQIDLTIYDHQYTPILYNRNNQRFIPAESVYAVFEVKQNLSRQNLIYASEKAKSVRQLQRTSTEIVHAGGQHPPRPPFSIIAGILTYESDWSPAFGDALRNTLSGLSSFQERIDLGSVVSEGSFEITYDSNKLEIEQSEKHLALVYFLFRLLGKLQKLGTVPAIDYEVYIEKILGI
jgi:hypothetical protein